MEDINSIKEKLANFIGGRKPEDDEVIMQRGDVDGKGNMFLQNTTFKDLAEFIEKAYTAGRRKGFMDHGMLLPKEEPAVDQSQACVVCGHTLYDKSCRNSSCSMYPGDAASLIFPSPV